MTRLDKELRKAGLIWDTDDMQAMRGAEYDHCQQLVDICGDIIVCVFYSAVLDPEFRLYDRHTLAFIGSQDVYPLYYECFGGARYNKWSSYGYIEEEEVA